MDQMINIMTRYGISRETMLDRLECFGGFAGYVEEIRADKADKDIQGNSE